MLTIRATPSTSARGEPNLYQSRACLSPPASPGPGRVGQKCSQERPGSSGAPRPARALGALTSEGVFVWIVSPPRWCVHAENGRCGRRERRNGGRAEDLGGGERRGGCPREIPADRQAGTGRDGRGLPGRRP